MQSSNGAGPAVLIPGLDELVGDGKLAVDDRRIKMERLRAEGVEPYPHLSCESRYTPIADLLGVHDPVGMRSGEHLGYSYWVAGRLIARRGHGKTMFMDLRDSSGQVQIVAKVDSIGEELYERIQDLDIGDLLSTKGYVYITQRGQLALSAHECTLLAKALRPPADKRHGLHHVETRYRHRELDLMSNEATRELFVTRARTIAEIRHRMDDHDFVEVETPVLQTLASGANARPFVTHHNALDCDLNLTISSELHLKRCVIGGLKNVYRLGKCFRNEGISYKHSPEFTMLEWMQSYADYMDVAQFTEEMVAGVAEQVLGTTEIECSGEAIDLSRPWRRVSMREAILEVTDIDVMTADSHQLAERLGERAYQHATHGQLTMALYSKLVEPTLIQPTMVLDFPISLLPLTKRHSEEPELAEHFDVVIGGIEIGCGDTELNDPREQRVRFADQRNQHCVKGERPQLLDEGFVQALEYGMPPTGGGGLGVDRLLMVLTGQETLREVVPFPTMRDRQ